MGGYERFTLCQHGKQDRPQISLSPFPCKKDGLLLNDNWEKRREMAEQQVLTKWCLFWGIRVQACKQDSYSEKYSNQTPGQNIPPYKMSGCCKELVDAQSPTVLYGYCFTCTHSFLLVFCKTPRFIATRSGGWPLGVNFKGDCQTMHPFFVTCGSKASTWCGLEHSRVARRSCEWLWCGVRSTRSETFGWQPQALSTSTDKVPWQKCLFAHIMPHRFVIFSHIRVSSYVVSQGNISSPSGRIWKEIVQTAGFLHVINRY